MVVPAKKKSTLRLSFFVIIKEEGLRKTPTMRKWMNKKATSSPSYYYTNDDKEES